jgi:hypothetical protein
MSGRGALLTSNGRAGASQKKDLCHLLSLALKLIADGCRSLMDAEIGTKRRYEDRSPQRPRNAWWGILECCCHPMRGRPSAMAIAADTNTQTVMSPSMTRVNYARFTRVTEHKPLLATARGRRVPRDAILGAICPALPMATRPATCYAAASTVQASLM